MPKHSYWRHAVFPDLPLPVEDQTPLPEHVWFSPFYRVGQHLQRVRSGNTHGPGMTGGEVSDQPNSLSQ